MIDIGLDGIKDPSVKDALYNIQQEFRDQKILNFFWTFFKVSFVASVTDYKFKHNLGYTPKDFLITSIRGNGTAYIDLDESDSQFLNITTTDSCTIRFLLGNLDENSTA